MGTMELSIRSFEPGDGEVFRALNEEWISRYFVMEADDELVLGDPEEHILRPGGEVFIARAEGRPVGCCALIIKEDGVIELSKMAVDPGYPGRGIGRRPIALRDSTGTGTRRESGGAGKQYAAEGSASFV